MEKGKKKRPHKIIIASIILALIIVQVARAFIFSDITRIEETMLSILTFLSVKNILE